MSEQLPLRARLLELLAQHPEGMSTNALRKAVNLSRTQVESKLRLLVVNNQVTVEDGIVNSNPARIYKLVSSAE
jgi:DNA-binding transcriptional ArsR family regulator